MNIKEKKTDSDSNLNSTNIEGRRDGLAMKNHQIVLKDGQVVSLRPLVPDDKAALVDFYSKLSESTRHLYVLDNYGDRTAIRLCESLSNPEKLNFVVQNNQSEIIALMKFSLDLPEEDRLRFLQYGIKLEPGIVCRCGLCVADQYQDMGLGAITTQQVIDISDSLGQKVIMLSGGIFAKNERAIHLTQKLGFNIVGRFIDLNGQEHVDMLRLKE